MNNIGMCQIKSIRTTSSWKTGQKQLKSIFNRFNFQCVKVIIFKNTKLLGKKNTPGIYFTTFGLNFQRLKSTLGSIFDFLKFFISLIIAYFSYQYFWRQNSSKFRPNRVLLHMSLNIAFKKNYNWIPTLKEM
jgi:hypothetical protein